MQNKIFNFPYPCLVKITIKYDWRDEPEKEVIALIDEPYNHIHATDQNLLYLKFPVKTEGDDIKTMAYSIGLYDTYDYTLKPVSEEDSIYWYKSMCDFAANISRKPADTSKLMLYSGDELTYKHR